MSSITYHKHHIIPKHMGGTDDSANIVYLTVPEHIAAHQLLYEQYGKIEDALAVRILSGWMNDDETVRELTKLGNRRMRELYPTLSKENGHKTQALHPEVRKNLCNSTEDAIKRNANPAYRVKQKAGCARRSSDPAYREKLAHSTIGQTMRALWRDPVYRAKMLTARRPT
jgi:hypothetical protein